MPRHMRPATPLVVTLAATLPTWCFAWHALAVPTTPAIRALPTAVRMVALAADPAAAAEEEVVPLLSGLNGKALKQYDVPSKVNAGLASIRVPLCEGTRALSQHPVAAS